MNGADLFTLIHVLLSIAGIIVGFVVVGGMLCGNSLPGWAAFFLITTVLTNVTGFFFPFHGVTPGIILGVLSLLVLAPCLYALYGKHLAGGWRKTYAITATVALYFNTFVLIAQLFQKVPALKALAPTQSEPPFAASQGALLILMIVLGTLAVKRFRSPALVI